MAVGMDQYSYYSEKSALKSQIRRSLSNYAGDLLKFYLANGFDALAISLQIRDHWHRKVVFDYLVFDQKAILECVRYNKQFFLKIISAGRGEIIRSMLGLKPSKYNQVWRETLDLLHLYYVERKVEEKLFNLSLEKFFENSILNKPEGTEE